MAFHPTSGLSFGRTRLPLVRKCFGAPEKSPGDTKLPPLLRDTRAEAALGLDNRLATGRPMSCPSFVITVRRGAPGWRPPSASAIFRNARASSLPASMASTARAVSETAVQSRPAPRISACSGRSRAANESFSRRMERSYRGWPPVGSCPGARQNRSRHGCDGSPAQRARLRTRRCPLRASREPRRQNGSSRARNVGGGEAGFHAR